MTLRDEELRSGVSDLSSTIPDLRHVRLDRLPELGRDSVLANSIALYLQRLQDSGAPVYQFNSGI